VTNEPIAEIPIFDVDLLPSADLCRRNLERVRALVDDALSRRSHPLLPLATRIVDRLSHSWLVRQTNPYLEEIRQVARTLGRPGAYFLNTIYEWACSTSLAPDPRSEGARMIRVLDWGLTGIGRHVVIARHETRHGAFFNATWPGYAGVVTGMAPGRFSAAINQGPRMPVSGLRWLDVAITLLQFLCARLAVPAAHLLRRAFEEASDFEGAVELLADDSIAVAAPALFAIAGVEPEECCVVEAWHRKRRVHRVDPAAPAALGIANQWLSRDLPGAARNRSLTTGPRTTPEENNAARQAMICRVQDGDFDGAADLREPVLNSHTVMVVVANARRGELSVEALDPPPGSLLPRVVARRSLCQPSREAREALP
jgi:hypothetical protein